MSSELIIDWKARAEKAEESSTLWFKRAESNAKERNELQFAITGGLAHTNGVDTNPAAFAGIAVKTREERDALRAELASLDAEASKGKPIAESVAEKIIRDTHHREYLVCVKEVSRTIQRERLVGELRVRKLRKALEQSAVAVHDLSDHPTTGEFRKCAHAGCERNAAALAATPETDALDKVVDTLRDLLHEADSQLPNADSISAIVRQLLRLLWETP